MSNVIGFSTCDHFILILAKGDEQCYQPSKDDDLCHRLGAWSRRLMLEKPFR
jgi:hypothetical protein